MHSGSSCEGDGLVRRCISARPLSTSRAASRALAANPETWDPFGSLDDLMFDLLDEENGGFDVAADVFAEANHG